MKFDYSGTHNTKEVLISPDRAIYSGAASVNIPFSVAASDRSGYCGGLSWDCVKWGTYSVVDQTKSYDCKDAEFVEEYAVDDLEAYYMEWENTQPRYKVLDNADSSIIEQFWGSTNSDIVDYPLPLFVAPEEPASSLAHDGASNILYSIKAEDGTVHNELVDSPEKVEDILSLPTTTTLYPIAPV